MAMRAQLQLGRPNRFSYTPISIPSSKIEYSFYFAMLYSITADIWGISVPMLSGGLFLLIAAVCVLQLRSFAKTIYSPIGLLIACVVSFFGHSVRDS